MISIDTRLRALLLTLALVIAIALLVGQWPGAARQQQTQTGRGQAVDTATGVLFDTAVAELRQRNYLRAIEGFSEVIKTTPAMPEAYVNLGFAYIGLKQFETSKQAFDTALELRSDQVNAYWGLAVSLEGLCDIPGAIGAMNTYIHLAKQDDPYLIRARSALWEWQQIKETAKLRNDHRAGCGP